MNQGHVRLNDMPKVVKIHCRRCKQPMKIEYAYPIYHSDFKEPIYLCPSCRSFIRSLFDDVIEEYILREE